MGLDCFWVKVVPAERMGIKPTEEYKLCGGMFSGDGAGSFRGKVYAGLIDQLCNISLYQELVPECQVKEIAKTLESARWENVLAMDFAYPISEQEFKGLSKMFRFYADNDCCLMGWW